MRRALQLSLNVPAVAVLDHIGASRFAARLEQAGGALALPVGEAPGLAMGLGGVGVTLADLVALYCGLPRLGTTVPLRERVPIAEERRAVTAAFWTPWRPGTSAIFFSERRHPSMLPAAGSHSRPARPMATATPGRWASTASAPSASGSAVPMARRCRA